MTPWMLFDSSLKAEFGTMTLALKQTGQEINANWMSRLTKVDCAGKAYFVKVYASRGRGLRAWLGRSRLRAEWENIRLFQSLGIPTVELVAYGEKLWPEYVGVMVTEDRSEAFDLAFLARENHSSLSNRCWRLRVIRRLSESIRTLHAARFVHNDLKWRNILVELPTKNKEAEPRAYLIDCPMGSKKRGLMLNRGIIKDLACLDKVAKLSLSRTDRLRFYLGYVSRKRLRNKDKVKIRKVLHFFKGRD